jgi:DNA-binding HxlR family transcriptional regulator
MGEGRKIPVASMVESIVGCKWSMAVLDAIAAGVERPGALQRHCAGISAKVLNERLRKLERFGVVDRVAYPEVPPRVEYRLTHFGRRFLPIIEAVRDLQSESDAPGAGSR